MRIVCGDEGVGEVVGNSSAIAITITVTTKTSEQYLATHLIMVGTNRVNEMAASALADLDTAIEPFHERLKVRATSQGE